MKLQLPESVVSYYKDLALRASVDALLTQPEKLPPDLRWEEMTVYYRAAQAADRFMIEHAIALHDLWTNAWGSMIPSVWKPQLPGDQIKIDKLTSPHALNVWREEWFARCHIRDGKTLCTCTSFDENAALIGFGLFDSGNLNMLPQPVDGFDLDPDTDVHWLAQSIPISGDGTLQLEPALGARSIALEAVEKATAKRSRLVR